MKIYLICSVRNATPQTMADTAEYVRGLEAQGHTIHYPPRDVAQDDPTGSIICATHLNAMRQCDAVHVLWDVNSKGSHFDLGMAYALGLPLVPVRCDPEDTPGKSYWKVICEYASRK